MSDLINNGQQLPPDVEYDATIVPQSTNTAVKVEKNVFDSRNYLDFSIPEGQKTKEITIRLLPISIKDGKPEFFQIVHLHNITVNKELKPNKSGKKAYMCLGPKNTGIDHEKYGSKCPICEAQQELWNKWHEETDATKKKLLIEEIKQLNIREYCIVRCIERGKEDEGPKFWRIPLRQDNTDAYHKIILLYEERKKEGEEAGVKTNILSLYNGRDLKVTFSEGNGAPTIMDKGVSTPITNDNELLNKWYYDEKKWSDVFSTKPYGYLKAAFDGDIPWFDNVNNCWVSKTEFDKSKSEIENNFNTQIKNVEKQFINEQPILAGDPFASYNNVDDFEGNVEFRNEVKISPFSVDDDLPF